MIRPLHNDVTANSVLNPIDPLLAGSTMASATELAKRVRLYLEGSNLPGLRRVDVEVVGDTVHLGGRVRSFYEKQLAVRLSGRVAGVIRVLDNIEVQAYVPQRDIAPAQRGWSHREPRSFA